MRKKILYGKHVHMCERIMKELYGIQQFLTTLFLVRKKFNSLRAYRHTFSFTHAFLLTDGLNLERVFDKKG